MAELSNTGVAGESPSNKLVNDVEIGGMDALETLPSVMKRRAPKVTKTPIKSGWFNLKNGVMALVGGHLLLHTILLLAEIIFVGMHVNYDATISPMLDPKNWPQERTEYRNHLWLALTKLVIDDGSLGIFVFLDGVFYSWKLFKKTFTCLFGDRKSKQAAILRSMLFLNLLFVAFGLKEYILACAYGPLHNCVSYETAWWPHQKISNVFLKLIGLDCVIAGFLASWEYWGDFRYFPEAAALTLFLCNVTLLMLEPSSPFLKLSYGSSLQQVSQGSFLADLVQGICKSTGFSSENFYYWKQVSKVNVYALGYRGNSAVIITQGLMQYLRRVAYIVAESFPETTGPDDQDQMLLAAVTHDIGHVMTSQMLVFDCLIFGVLYSGLAWLIIKHFLQRPIRFRSFGFKHKPIPPVCAIIVVGIAGILAKGIIGNPAINAINWLREAEADAYAVSFGFGPTLHRYLFALEASGQTGCRPPSLLYALYNHRHPPYRLRVKWLNS